MPNFQIKRSVWIRLSFALAVLVIPASIYFFTYFNTKYDFAVQHHFRALNGLERQFVRGLAHVENIFRYSNVLRYPKEQVLTLSEQQEARDVISDYRAHMEDWSSWTGQLILPKSSDYQLARHQLDKLNEEMAELIWEMQDFELSLTEDVDFFIRELEGEGKLDKEDLAAIAADQNHQASLDIILRELPQSKDEKEALRQSIDDLNDYKSLLEDEKNRLDQEIQVLKNSLDANANRLQEPEENRAARFNADVPPELKTEQLAQWKKFLPPSIEKMMAAYRCARIENDKHPCMEGLEGNPNEVARQLEEKFEASIWELESVLSQENSFAQQISTSSVYGNTRIDLIDAKDCKMSDTKYFALTFKVSEPDELFNLLVKDACANSIETRASNKGILQARIPIRDLLQPDSALHYFDQIMVVDAKGRVLYRSGEEDAISLDDYNGLQTVANRNDFARFTDLSGLITRVNKRNVLVDAALPEQSAGTLAGIHSRVVEETVGDMPHLFFLQPLRPPISETGESKADQDNSWHVIGVVRKSKLVSDVSHVSLNVMGALILVMLLLLLAVPLLKLQFAAVTEPISRVQVYLLTVSLVLGACILTLIVLDVRAYTGLKDRMDATAERISKEMSTRFDQELTTSIKESEEAFPNMPLPKIKQRTSSDSGFCWNFNEAKTGLRENMETIKEDYPPWELAYLLDAEGTQVGSQRTYRNKFASTIRVPKRKYFLRARDDQLWQRAAGEKFFLERIFTYDHGWWLTALSMPASTNDFAGQGCDNTAKVRVTLKKMQSFFNIGLPPAFGFAVFEDDSGKVVYHSDNDRSLLENFYVETDNNRQLIAAVRARRPEEVTSDYHGQSHRFYVAPVENTSWTLVVFYDKTLIRTLNFETVISTTTALVFYVLAIFVGLLLFRVVFQRRRWRFLWPRSALLREYRFLAVILLISLVLAALPRSYGSWWAMLPVLMLPLYTLCVIAAVLDDKRRWRSSTASYHVKRTLTHLALLLILLGLLPGTVGAWKILGSVLALAALLVIRKSRMGQAYPPEINQPDRGQATHFWYLACAVLALALFTMHPTKMLFDEIHSLQTDKLLRVLEHHEERRAEVRSQAIAQDLLRINPHINADSHKADSEETGKNSSANEDQSGGQSQTADNRTLASSTKEKSDSCEAEPSKREQELCRLYDKYPMSILTENFPSYSPLSAWLHVMLIEDVNDSTDAEQKEKKSNGKEGYGIFSVSGDTLLPPDKGDVEFLTPFNLGIALTLFLMLFALRSTSQRVLGLDFPVIRTRWDLDDAEEWRGVRRVALVPTAEFMQDLKMLLAKLGQVREIDLSTSMDQQQLLELVEQLDSKDHDVVILKSPDIIGCDPDTREQLAEAVERLDACPEITLVLCTGLFPWLNLALADNQLAPEDFSDSELKRWQTLLRRFQSGYADLGSQKPSTSIEVLLRHECRHSELAEIRKSIESRPSFKRAAELQKDSWKNVYSVFRSFVKEPDSKDEILSAKELIDEVAYRAEEFHRQLWQCCSKEEQYVLYRMAQGNMVNTLNTRLLERLLRLGLIRQDPDFRIASFSLRNFILSEESPENAIAFEKQTEESVWTYLRFPLLLLLLTLTVFLAFVGPDVVESLLGLIPAIVLGLPLALRMFSRGSGL